MQTGLACSIVVNYVTGLWIVECTIARSHATLRMWLYHIAPGLWTSSLTAHAERLPWLSLALNLGNLVPIESLVARKLADESYHAVTVARRLVTQVTAVLAISKSQFHADAAVIHATSSVIRLHKNFHCAIVCAKLH